MPRAPASTATSETVSDPLGRAGAGGLIVASSPFLALGMLAVKLKGGAVLYRQTRVGKDGLAFALPGLHDVGDRHGYSITSSAR